MIATVSLIVCVLLGYAGGTMLWLIPISILNGFLGLHFPPGKAAILAGRGEYWATYFYSLPLQCVLAAGLYGLGKLISLIF